MQGEAFDNLSRALAETTSRRQALKILASATLGVLVGSRSERARAASCAHGGESCKSASECCSGLTCQRGVCCGQAGAATPFCCDGLVVDNFSLTCVACGTAGTPCGQFAKSCCPGLVCNSTSGTCTHCKTGGASCL